MIRRTVLVWLLVIPAASVSAQDLLGVKPIVKAQTEQGATALIIASRRGFAEVVRALLDKKADPDIADFTGRRALTYAKQGGRTPIEEMLCKAGGRE